MPYNQALIKSKPGLTKEQFSELWYAHGALVTPMFLYSGVQYYAQIHGPLTNTSSTSTLDLSSWAGAAEKPTSETPDPQWINEYYREVVMVDEKGFLDRGNEEWFKRVEPDTVEGERRVIIEGGKSMIEVPESVMKVWREYEERGKEANHESGGPAENER